MLIGDKYKVMRKYVVVDVDGTLTDAGVFYDEKGNELKKFCTRDAAAFFACKELGIKVVVVTGRTCIATERRMRELKVDFLFQEVKNKTDFLKIFMREHEICSDDVMYIGDDLNDYFAMQLVGFVGCPADSCKEIKEMANYISSKKGGQGAVRDIIEYVLEKEGVWEQVIRKIYSGC